MSVLKMRVDGRYCFRVSGGSWVSKNKCRGGTQKFSKYKDRSLTVYVTQHAQSLSHSTLQSPQDENVGQNFLPKISRGVVPEDAIPEGAPAKTWPWLKGSSGCNPGRTASTSRPLRTAHDSANSHHMPLLHSRPWMSRTSGPLPSCA